MFAAGQARRGREDSRPQGPSSGPLRGRGGRTAGKKGMDRRGMSTILLGLITAIVLGVVQGAAGTCCTAVPSSGPRALVVLADSLVLGGGLRLRGGGGSSGGEDVDASMRDGGGKDEAPAQSSADLDEDSDEVAGITVPVTIQSTCFGRNDFFNVSVEPTMLVKDLKRELYANFSSQVCDSEQMELWWAGKELKGLSSDSLRSYGFGRELTRILVRAGMRERIIVRHKFMFSSQFAGEATKRQQQRGGAHLGLGGQQAQVAAMHNARMQELLQNPAELQRLMQSPEFQQILASNPEVCARSAAIRGYAALLSSSASPCRGRAPLLCEVGHMQAQGVRGLNAHRCAFAAGRRNTQGPRDAAEDHASSK